MQLHEPRESMIWIPGGSFLMGSNEFYREERPVRRETVHGFWIDPYPVTNAEFRKFVGATGYVTTCERPPDPAMYPDADPALLVPGSSVFRKPPARVDLRDYRAWWEYVPGADWRHPEGPDSNIDGRDDHPVVHVAYEDACAYAAWAGKELPIESEWEFAARGGLDGATYAWGEAFAPQGRANGQHLAGPIPLGEPQARWIRGHLSGRRLSRKRLWALRHDRQCLGVDRERLHRACAAKSPKNPVACRARPAAISLAGW